MNQHPDRLDANLTRLRRAVLQERPSHSVPPARDADISSRPPLIQRLMFWRSL